MQNFIPLLVGIIALGVGAILGYYLRQSLVKKRAGNLEKIVQEKISKAKRDSENLISEAKKKALGLVGAVKREEEDRRRQLYKTEQVLLKRPEDLKL